MYELRKLLVEESRAPCGFWILWISTTIHQICGCDWVVCRLDLVGISAMGSTIPAEIVGTVGLTGLTGLRILRTPTDFILRQSLCVYIVGLCPARRVQGFQAIQSILCCAHCKFPLSPSYSNRSRGCGLCLGLDLRLLTAET